VIFSHSLHTNSRVVHQK